MCRRCGLSLLPRRAAIAPWAVAMASALPARAQEAAGACEPPSAIGLVLVLVLTLALGVFFTFILKRVVELRFIQRDRSPTLGRYFGLILALGLTVLCGFGLAWWASGCIHSSYWALLGIGGLVCALLGIYTWWAVRGR
jgi:hypothetical protein